MAETFPEKSVGLVVGCRPHPASTRMAPPSPPSRQERRKAERAAAKRAPAQARAAKAAAALANVALKPLGDWTTQSEDPMRMFKALGYHALQQKVDATGG